jgi:hypothetical protein
MRRILAATAATVMVTGLGVAGAAPASAKDAVTCGKVAVRNAVDVGGERILAGTYRLQATSRQACRLAREDLGLQRVQGTRTYRLDGDGVRVPESYDFGGQRCFLGAFGLACVVELR